MRTFRLGLICLFAAAWLAGCAEYHSAAMKLGPASDVVSASIENLGWAKAFGGRLGSASFVAIVTTCDKDGQKYTDRQEMVVDLAANRITAAGATPQGTWQATATPGGVLSVHAQAGVNTALVRRRMGPTLALLLHRLRGPYNLLEGKESARAPQKDQVGGLEVIRVGVTGEGRMAVAYYFGSATGILKYVTAGADSPGSNGTVTSYEYRSLKNGATFPSLIQVNRIGRNVLLGQIPVFQVEISDVKF